VSDSAQASRPELIRSIVHRPAGEEVVALPVEGRLASFDRARAWLNSDSLTLAGLHGRVVVVDFWTYTWSGAFDHWRPDAGPESPNAPQ
jgi:hypothetical protein